MKNSNKIIFNGIGEDRNNHEWEKYIQTCELCKFTHTQTYPYIYTCRHTYTHIKFRMNCEDYINDYQW